MVESTQGQMLRVLYVEDEILVANARRRDLKKFGIDVIIALGLVTARAFLTQVPTGFFRVILLDLQLRKERGEDLLDHIARLTQPPPVIVLSGYLDSIRPEAVGRCVLCVPKTVASENLAAHVREAVEREAARPKPKARLSLVEEEHITAMLVECKGNRSEAARRLGIARSTLQRRLRFLSPNAQHALASQTKA